MYKNRSQVLGMAFGGFVILGALGVLSAWSVFAFRDLSDQRERANEIIGQLNQIVILVVDAETAQRGFVLTEDEAFLAPYHRSRGLIEFRMKELSTLIQPNSSTEPEVLKLAQLVQQKFSSMQTSIDLVRSGQHQQALERVKSRYGKGIMDALRAQIDELREKISRKLALQDIATKKALERTIWIVIAGLASAFALFFLCATMLRREMRRRVQVEKDLVTARERAQEASKLKSSFLAHMSHEIRTPLNGIIGSAKLLSLTKLDAEQKQQLSLIRFSSNSLLSIINEILDFSKIESGKLELDESNFETTSLLGGVVEMLSHQAADNGVKLRLETAADVPPFLIGDPLRLRQVLINLLGNAIKFSKDSDVILRVSVPSAKDSIAHLLFEVIDCGPGIDPVIRKRLFQPFEQGDASTTRRFGGTGLGLVISRQLVELMGGMIDVESEVGQGSRFYFRIGFRVANFQAAGMWESKNDENSELGLVDKSIGRVLIVEDNLVNQKVAQGMLKILGYETVVAASGREALKWLASSDFDAVIMDGHMPELDGYETTRLIRAGTDGIRNVKIPIIAATANAIKGERERCLEAGMDDYLSKPINLEDLQLKLEKWVQAHEKPIDLSVIEQLKPFDDDGSLVREIVKIFTESLPQAIGEMRRLLQEENFVELGKLAHHTKSTCANVGALKMTYLCQMLESIKDATGTASARKLLDELNEQHPIACEILASAQASTGKPA